MELTGFFKYKNKILTGDILTEDSLGFYVQTPEFIQYVLKEAMLWIPNFPEQEWPVGQRPMFSYQPEEFLVLWNEDRTDEDNLHDIYRYFLQNSAPKYSRRFWALMLGELWDKIDNSQSRKAWVDAKIVEQISMENDLSEYHQGQRVKFSLHNDIYIEFSPHAIERMFERLQVCPENFKSLVFQMLQESVPVVSNKKKKPNDVFLYHKDFHWAFLLRKTSSDEKGYSAYIVVTCYEPHIYWRKCPVQIGTPFLEEVE